MTTSCLADSDAVDASPQPFDFAAFATQEDRQTVRELRLLHVQPGPLIWEIHVHGESFLRHMVRGLVGTLLIGVQAASRSRYRAAMPGL